MQFKDYFSGKEKIFSVNDEKTEVHSLKVLNLPRLQLQGSQTSPACNDLPLKVMILVDQEDWLSVAARKIE